MIGDGDDGYVLNLGGRNEEGRSWACVGAVLFEDRELKSLAGEYREPAFWLLGAEGRRRFERMPNAASTLRSRALPSSGYYLLQSGDRDDPSSVSLLFDCGELGFSSLAAHGHADALSVCLRVGGRDVLVDPGTYDYFTYAPWRTYFRSTRAHNTVMIDDRDQSEMLGSFLWGQRARGRCLHWEATPEGGIVVGEHDGYVRLRRPVIHRRAVALTKGELRVEDELLARGAHDAAQYWHFAESCEVRAAADQVFEVTHEKGRLTMQTSEALTWRLHRGSEHPILGWVSRGYHRKSPSWTLVGRGRFHGAVTLATCLHWEPGDAAASLPLTSRTQRAERSAGANREPRASNQTRVPKQKASLPHGRGTVLFKTFQTAPPTRGRRRNGSSMASGSREERSTET